MNETIAAEVVSTQPEITFSIFNYLPQNGFTDALISINSQMSVALQPHIPHKWFLMPLIYDPLATLLVAAIIALTFTLFMDFLRQAWKIPLAMIVDVLDVIAITNPFFNAFAALGSIGIFMILSRHHSLFWKFGFIGAALFKTFTPGLALLPLNTVIMCIAIVTGRD